MLPQALCLLPGLESGGRALDGLELVLHHSGATLGELDAVARLPELRLEAEQAFADEGLLPGHGPIAASAPQRAQDRDRRGHAEEPAEDGQVHTRTYRCFSSSLTRPATPWIRATARRAIRSVFYVDRRRVPLMKASAMPRSTSALGSGRMAATPENVSTVLAVSADVTCR